MNESKYFLNGKKSWLKQKGEIIFRYSLRFFHVGQNNTTNKVNVSFIYILCDVAAVS